MDYGDYCWRLYRDYCKDPFPHSLLSTRVIAAVTCALLNSTAVRVGVSEILPSAAR